MTAKITTTVTRKSDMSGQEATTQRVLTVGGRTAHLDFTDKEAAKFDETVGRYFAKAHQVDVTPDELRGWARANGHAVGERGRLNSAIREAYDAAMGAAVETTEAE